MSYASSTIGSETPSMAVIGRSTTTNSSTPRSWPFATNTAPTAPSSSAARAAFRNDVVTGPGGRQILLQDPSGNLIELFQPADR